MEDDQIRSLIEQVGIPLIRRLMIRRHQLKVCGFISQEFVNALAKMGIEARVVDTGRHATALVTLPSGTWDVDLSYAQFLCDLDEDSEVTAMISKIESDPWETIRYSRTIARNGATALYHGSMSADLEELDGNDPGYTGSLGWGLYLTTDPDFARKFGKRIYEVESPVPEELVADIEPDLYDCGNDLTFYTPGSAPFTFEIVDRKTGETHRYSILGDCDEQVKASLRADVLGTKELPENLQEKVRSQAPGVRVAVSELLSDAIVSIAKGERIDDVVEGLVEEEAEENDRWSDEDLSAIEALLTECLERVDADADQLVSERLGTEIDLDDISATVSEHGYSAFFISGYAPGDEYVVVDTEYLPIPVTK